MKSVLTCLMSLLFSAIAFTAPNANAATKLPVGGGPGAGMTIETKDEKLVSADGPERCYVNVDEKAGTLSIVTSPPSMAAFPSEFILKTATQNVVGPTTAIYTSTNPDYTCGSLASVSKLIVDGSVYKLITDVKCAPHGGDAATSRSYERTCDLGFTTKK